MSRWSEVVADSPAVAAMARRLWPGIVALERGDRPTTGQVFSLAYLATIRPDGGPRLHPFCPILAGGGLYAAISRRSPKGRDLRRDPRCGIHALPGPDDDELCIRATAVEVTAAAVRASVLGVVGRSAVGGMIETVANDRLFEFDVDRVDIARWVNIGQPGTHAVRERWLES